MATARTRSTALHHSIPVPPARGGARPYPGAPADVALVRLIARGDPGALSGLYASHRIRALDLAYRLVGDRQLAEEVTQEAFVEVWRHASSYDAGDGSVRAWIFAIVRRTALRNASAPHQVSLEQARTSSSSNDAFLGTYESVRRAEVRACLRRIPREQRSAIERAFFSGETFAAISREAGVPVGTMKSRVRLGIAKLRRMLAAGA